MGSNKENYIERLKKQKQDALEFVVDEYLPLVKVVVYKILHPLGQEEAEKECINDIFMAIWEHSKQFNGVEEDFKKWVYKIAKYESIDYYRKLTKKLEISLEEEQLQEASQPTPEDILIINESKEELIQLINTLDEVDRQIFIRKYFLGNTSDEVGKQLNLSRTAVDNRIYRAKARLRRNVVVLKEAMI